MLEKIRANSKELFVVVMFVFLVGLLAGTLVVSLTDGGDTSPEQTSPEATTEQKVNISEEYKRGIGEFKKTAASSSAISNVEVYVSPSKEYNLAALEIQGDNPTETMKMLAVEYAEVVGENNAINKTIVMRSDNLEVVVPEVPLQNYNEGELEEKAFKKTIEVRLVNSQQS